VAPPPTNTGLKFVTKGNVRAYSAQQTRFEGSTSTQKYITHSGAIST
jgi:simple sugar transport system substrate-binding protein